MLRLLLLICLLFSTAASAGLFDSNRPPASLSASSSAGDFLPVDQAFRIERLTSNPDRLTLRFIIAEGYYLYRQRFQFSTTPPGLIGDVTLPTGEPKHDEWFGDVEVYHAVVDIDIPLTAPDAVGQLSVTYQGCADKGLCYPPETKRIALSESLGTPSSVSVASGDTKPVAPGWQWRDLALFFLAGLGLTFTPCVLPMLPIMSSIVLRSRHAEHPTVGRGLLLSLAYVLPMAACFALLGSLMGLFGAGLNLQARLQSAWILIPFAAFFVLFALAMFGLFELRLPAFIRHPVDRLASGAKGGSVLGAATLGVLSSLLVSPCVSAPLAGALLYISSSGDAVGGGLKLFALGLGMGAPLVLFATGGGALMPRSGAWMIGVRNAFGVLLLGVAIWLLERLLPGPLALALWGLLAAGTALFLGALEFTVKTPRQRLAQLAGIALLVYAISSWIGALQGQSDPLRPLPPVQTTATSTVEPAQSWQTVTTPAALDQALKEAEVNHQPVVLDWYADWCISCKVIERDVFNTPSVAHELATFRLIRFDITASNAAQRQLLDRYALFGPPAIQFFDRNGQERRDIRVIGEIDASTFLNKLQRFKESL
ncbi:thiol:disulfide interchange protein DsbD [Pseudomonas duriflava]|uniref:Thiol:disulfide interchange protein DsbD n=1 Tax=Pseudomonas duriflava TaxID=459528 RepID=A0A562QNX8_9PSED|nr:protein-disulfide reductase DsbD [Pseudomonas duriflava]TWI58373.1 thiol:disulfide interchange protein DsbD [Pseudomonas duriflava]